SAIEHRPHRGVNALRKPSMSQWVIAYGTSLPGALASAARRFQGGPASPMDDVEISQFHSITASARSRDGFGIVMPSALAVLRLITRSNLVGCSTGRSASFAPRRIFLGY